MKTILNYDDFIKESHGKYTQKENIDLEASEQDLNESKLQDDYREFFKHVLDLYEVKSPASIKDEDCKKEFFNKIQKGWIKGEGLSEYGKRLMDFECLDENGECCEKDDE